MQYEQKACQSATDSSSHRLVHLEYGCFSIDLSKSPPLAMFVETVDGRHSRFIRDCPVIITDTVNSLNYQDSNLDELI